MGVTFIGNPFDQDNDYYDSDWEVTLNEELINEPQLTEILDRAQFNLILAAGAESSGEDSDLNWEDSNNDDDSDEDYVPNADDLTSENDIADMISEPDPFHTDSDDSEDIDYVTYPLNSTVEADKITPDSSNNRGNSDTD